MEKLTARIFLSDWIVGKTFISQIIHPFIFYLSLRAEQECDIKSKEMKTIWKMRC